MIRLSAFADEISPDPAEQVALLRDEGIGYLDLRSAWGANVLDLSDVQVAALRVMLRESSVRVAAIGSPVGKVPIDAPWHDEIERLERAITLARTFDTPFIRIFSFYPPAAGSGLEPSTCTGVGAWTGMPEADPAPRRDEVLRRLREMTARARAAGVILLHENEKGIYGDTIARCVDLLRSIDDAHFRAVLDPANYIQCGQAPYPEGYDALRPWLSSIHVKDARADGTVVAVGDGEARWPDLVQCLRADRYDGVLSLEPHLATAGQSAGFSGPDLFRHAARSLMRLLRGEDASTLS